MDMSPWGHIKEAKRNTSEYHMRTSMVLSFHPETSMKRTLLFWRIFSPQVGMVLHCLASRLARQWPFLALGP